MPTRLAPYSRPLVDRFPGLRAYSRRIRFAQWRSKMAIRSGLRRARIDPVRLLWVDPRKITDVCVGIDWATYDKAHELGRIVGGDWDLNTMPFEHLDVYQAIRARFVHGARWEDTGYYKSLLARLEYGERPWPFRSKDDLPRRLQELDALFAEISEHGHRAQRQCPDNRYWHQWMDEVSVRIARDGELLFEDGRHRLSIAKTLGVSQIPIVVTWRHREWYRLRARILAYARRHGGKIPSPMTHPDLPDIPSAHEDTRFELMRAHLPVKGGSLLDLGARWGYFCHRFEDEGFHCYALEKSPEDFSFLNRLKLAERRAFTAVHADIFQFWEQSEFDVVLALGVFDRFLKTAEVCATLVNFLRRLRIKVMFFAPQLPADVRTREAYRNFDDEEFVGFVADNTGLHHWECIGDGEDGRPIYRLTGG